MPDNTHSILAQLVFEWEKRHLLELTLVHMLMIYLYLDDHSLFSCSCLARVPRFYKPQPIMNNSNKANSFGG